jgi:hypothetical protein
VSVPTLVSRTVVGPTCVWRIQEVPSPVGVVVESREAALRFTADTDEDDCFGRSLSVHSERQKAEARRLPTPSTFNI